MTRPKTKGDILSIWWDRSRIFISKTKKIMRLLLAKHYKLALSRESNTYPLSVKNSHSTGPTKDLDLKFVFSRRLPALYLK